MKFLLDTCTFLWLNLNSRKVPPAIMKLCADPANRLFLSVVSSWEIDLNVRLGRLVCPSRRRFTYPRGGPHPKSRPFP